MMRNAAVFLILVLVLIAGAGQLVRLEQRDGARLRERAERQEKRVFVLPAVRGSILDARGRPLVSTVRRPSVFVDPGLVRNYVTECEDVAEILGLDPIALAEEISRRRSQGNRYWQLQQQISAAQAESIRALVAAGRTRAFGIEMENWRDYPFDRTAALILGFVGSERRGMAGIELTFDDILRGRDGRRYSTVDARKRRIRSLEDETVPAQDGGSVVLTIDATIQQLAEKHLKAGIDHCRADWGVAIVLEPYSGEVLACAVMPDYDPLNPFPKNLSKEQAQRNQINHAIASSYEPGSIFKPIIVAGAVDEGVIGLDDELEIDGPVRRWPGRTIHDTKPHDVLPLWGVLTHSSNIGMGVLGDRCGNERLHEYVRRFGFGERTGVRLPGEAKGLVSRLKSWTRYSTQSVPIGQELATTPIQMIAAFASLCNDGVLVRPRFVRGVLAPDGTTLEDESRPIPIRRVVRSEVAHSLREQGLRSVVAEGTGHRANLERWQVFGKTGTGQFAVKGGYHDEDHNVSFVCGAPLESPQITVLVSFYREKIADDSGGKVAAPVAKLIVADTLEYLQGPVEPAPQ